jgi:hypothetical protein
MEDRFIKLMTRLLGDTEGRIDSRIDEEVLYRIERIEENERLSSRVLTEKRDEIKPLAKYPIRPADEETLRKAISQLNNRVKVIEKSMTYRSDKYNFVQAVAAESNTIARDYALNKEQQRNLILSYLPNTEYFYRVLNLDKSLAGTLATISTFSTNVVTTNDLERQLNEWILLNDSQTIMFDCLNNLLDMLNRSREDYGKADPYIPALFKAAISRIQRQSNIPRIIRESLFEARLRIREEDSINENINVLVAACFRWIGMKTSRAQVNSISKGTEQLAGAQVPQKGKKTAKVLVVDGGNANSSQVPAQNKNKNQNQNNQGQGKKKGENKGEDKGQGQQKTNKKPFAKMSFVAPWPEGTPYLSKNGNTLSREVEKWFKNHCYRCGHSSHNADKCRTYTDKSTVLTLCSTCRQGFHDCCKSKRPDLVKGMGGQNVKKAVFHQPPPVAPMAPMYMWPYPPPPPPVQSSGKKAVDFPVLSSSDSE